MFLAHLEGHAMRYLPIQVMASIVMLAIVILTPPQSSAQVKRPAPSQPTKPMNMTMSVRPAVTNSANISPILFTPRFNSSLAAQHQLTAVERALFHQMLLNRYLLNRGMYGGGSYMYGMPYMYPYAGYPSMNGYYDSYLGPSLTGSQSAYSADNGMANSKATSEYAPSATPNKTDLAIFDGPISERKITIPVGTTVEWTNQGDESHTITAVDGSWHATLKPKESFSRTFMHAGTYQYQAGEGPDKITGTIVVKN
jgi:plastocyanin